MIQKKTNIYFIREYLKALFSFSNKKINQLIALYIFLSVLSPILDLFTISYIRSYVLALTSKSEFIQKIFNFKFIVDPTSINTYIYFIFICLFTYLIKVLVTYLTYYNGAIYGNSIIKKFISVFSKISYDFYLNLKESEFVNYYQENINSSVSAINASFNLVSSLITFSIYLIYVYLTIPFSLFFFLILGSLIYYLFINIFIGKRVISISRKINLINPIRVKKVLDFYSLYKFVKIFNLSKIFLNNLLKSDKEYRFYEAKAPFLISLPTITIIYLFYLLGVSIVFFQTQIGLFNIYLIQGLSLGLIVQRMIPTSNMILNSLNSIKFKSIFLLEIYKEYNLMIESSQNDIFRSPEFYKEKKSSNDNDESLITFYKVNFRFSDSSKNLYKQDLSFEIKRNSNVLITGPSGSGKSTLIDLLLCLREPSKGNILFRSDIKKFSDFLTYVPQNFIIFDGTLIQNIMIEENVYLANKSNPNLQEIIECCLLGDIIKGSPKGIHQQIGNSGIQLSGGQLQRLSIARALYRKAPLLIMDEPTSSLDEKNSDQLMKNLIKYADKNSMTIVVVSHDKNIFDLFENRINL